MDNNSYRFTQLFNRTWGLMIKPRKEWIKIASEKPSVVGLLFKYVLVLALIPPFFILFYVLIFEHKDIFLRLTGFYYGYTKAISNYCTSIISIYFISFIMNKLAPSFGAEKNYGRALQTIVFSMTPYWVCGFIYQIPGLSTYLIVLVAIYAIYLLFSGLPLMMKTPAKKAASYAVVTFVFTILVVSVLNLLSKELLNLIFQSTSDISIKGSMF